MVSTLNGPSNNYSVLIRNKILGNCLHTQIGNTELSEQKLGFLRSTTHRDATTLQA